MDGTHSTSRSHVSGHRKGPRGIRAVRRRTRERPDALHQAVLGVLNTAGTPTTRMAGRPGNADLWSAQRPGGPRRRRLQPSGWLSSWRISLKAGWRATAERWPALPVGSGIAPRSEATGATPIEQKRGQALDRRMALFSARPSPGRTARDSGAPVSDRHRAGARNLRL